MARPHSHERAYCGAPVHSPIGCKRDREEVRARLLLTTTSSQVLDEASTGFA
jgi:hypothetical protein